ncbi:MAG: Uma2 family endonuclease [Cyanobacteria bacterium]|nr:Uma2 family endonuclease [Cyanobacteriota bacterium]
MTLSSIPAAPEATTGADGLAPLRFPPQLRLTPEQFALVCAENREAVPELAADGSLIVITPTGSETAASNTRLEMRLLLWADQHGGWKVFGSSSGFRLPDGSVPSPAASLVALHRWQALSAEQRRGFAPLCPDLVLELASPSDEGVRGITALRRKMDIYQRNGARLGWLLLPEQRAVEVWSADGEPQRFNNLQLLEAGAPFQDLQLLIEEIWAA